MQTYIENLVRQAHANWNSLEAVDTMMNETALLTQGILKFIQNVLILIGTYTNDQKKVFERFLIKLKI